jgi:putative membrane protein
MMHGYWGFPGGFGWFGSIFMVIFWIAIIIGIFWLFRVFGLSHCYNKSNSESLLDILKRRYASGEISKEEYETKKKELGL